jgi:hypothetical protein
MHRTYLLITFLAAFAALLVGVHLGKRLSPSSLQTATTTPTPTASPESTTSATQLYTNTMCGFTLQVPTTLSFMEGASGSAFLINANNQNESIAIACQSDIPRPPLTLDKIETVILYNEAKTASAAAKLYHDASAKDGTPLDQFIFYHPTKDMDVFIAGFGKTFDTVIATLKLTL